MSIEWSSVQSFFSLSSGSSKVEGGGEIEAIGKSPQWGTNETNFAIEDWGKRLWGSS